MRLKATASAIAISTALVAQNAAAQSSPIRFEIEAKPVTLALQEFAEQSGYQMAFLAEAAAGVTAHSVSGALAPEVALQRLLDGTGLEFRVIDERTIAILQKTAETQTEGQAGQGSLQYASADAQGQDSRPIQQLAQAQLQTAQTQAQTQATGGEASGVEEIVVTGSRLTGTNLTSPVPVFQFDAAEIDSRGAARIEDVLNVMPQVVPAEDTATGFGASGVSTLDLRGLGPIRTLALIDGKRLPFGSPEVSAANMDIVPTQLVERVDLVTGGASAVYGADAVAGVVNFVLKDDFEGIEIDSQVGFHQTANDNKLVEEVTSRAGITNPGSESDGRDVFATILLGANTPDEKGNVTAYFQYNNLNDIPSANRDNGACTLNDTTGPLSFRGVGCTGSSNFRRFFPNEGPSLFQTADGTLKLFEGGPTETFNFEPTNTLQRKQERFMFNARGHYDVTDNVEIYGDFSFMNNESQAAVAPTATFGDPFMVNCDNPLLDDAPDGELGDLFDVFNCQQVLDAVNNGEPNPVTGELDSVDIPFTNSIRLATADPTQGEALEGPDGPLRRIDQIKITTWRAIVGFRGTIADHFDWDVFGQFSRVLQDRFDINNLNFDRVQQGLFVVEDPETGEVGCRQPATSGCVPFNIFDRTADGETLLTQEALAFTTGTAGIVTGETEQQVVGGTIQGDLGRYGFQSPAADSGISLLVGTEYREDTLELLPDGLSQAPAGPGSLVGGGGFAPVAGRVEVVEGYMETQIPLIENKPFFDSWTLNGAYRRSQYTTDGEINQEDFKNEFNTDTWFVGTTWAPNAQVRARAQFQRAVRAPNVIELFSPQNVGGFEVNGDPCAGPNPSATPEQCARTGVTQGQFGNIPIQPSQEFNSVTGGNPDLLPEVADTVTVGLQFTPDFLPGLSLTADYFNIEIEDSIDTIPPDISLFRCLETGNPQFCDLIVRDDFGTLFLQTDTSKGVFATNVNISTIETSGIDFSVRYDLDLADLGWDSVGSVNFDYAATWTTEFEEVPLPGAGVIDCQDKFGDTCGEPQPAYKHRFLTTWNAPWGMQASVTWRRIGDTDVDAPVVFTEIDSSIDTKDYIDLVLKQDITDNFRFRIGVNNLFDTGIPLATVGSQGENGNTFPNVFDIDRFIFFGINVNL